MKRIDITTTPKDEVIAVTLDVLKSGGLVIFPTETTYGAGVDATNPKAVEKLLAYKSRREGKPLSIAVSSAEMADQYVQRNEQATKLYQTYLPGPVTVVSKSKGTVAPGVASEFNTVGVRWPDYPLLLEIIEAFGKPITATSANASNKKRPYSISDVIDNISNSQKEKIDLILDAHTLPKNEPSTVIDTTLPSPVAVRKGSIAISSETSVTHVTKAESETKELAGKLCLQHWNSIRDTGLVILLSGELGVGKTVFTKGVASFLQIHEEITSPTYSYREEYPYQRHQTSGMLYHYDMWKVTPEILPRLELEETLKPGNVIVIEWADQIFEKITSLLKSKKIQSCNISFLEQENNSRSITIS